MKLEQKLAAHRHKDGSVGHSGPGRPEMAENVARDIQMVRHPGDEFKTASNKRVPRSGVKGKLAKRRLKTFLVATVTATAFAGPLAAQHYVRVEPLQAGESVSGSGPVQTCSLREGGATTVDRTCITAEGLQQLADDVEEL